MWEMLATFFAAPILGGLSDAYGRRRVLLMALGGLALDYLLLAVAHTLPNDARVMGDFEVPTATLATIRVPALVMGGSKAKPDMVAAVNGVAAAVPGAVHKTLAGQTHQVKDEAIAPELIAFFR